MRRFLRRIAAPALALAVLECDSASPTVIVAPVEPTLDLVLNFCPTEKPVFLAIQNEGAAWTPVTLANGAATTVKVTNKVGLAATVEDFGTTLTLVVYASATEMNTFFADAGCVTGSGKTLTGTVSALTSAQFAYIWMESEFGFASGSAPTPGYTLSGLPNGALDLISLRQTSGAPDKIIVRRQLDLPTNSVIPLLDFAAAEAVAPSTGSVTLSGLGGQEFGQTSLTFRSAGGTEIFFDEPANALRGVPASLTQPGDVHVIATTAQSNSGFGGGFRSVTQYHRNLGNHVATFGPPLNTPAVSTIAVFPSRRMRAQIASQPEYGGSAAAVFAADAGGFVVIMTAAFAGGTPTQWTLDVPELATVQGFPAAGRLPGDAQALVVQASSSVAGFNLDVGTDGTVIKAAQYSMFGDLIPSGAARGRSLRVFGTMRGGMMPQKTR